MPIKTLLVDDERPLLEQAKIFLEKEDRDIQTKTAISAEKALDMIDEDDFDVIVSDYQMPEIDGLDFLRILREERDDDIPFIMFTGKGREKVAMKALNLGADRYLQKGGEPESQYAVLADAIGQEYEHLESKKRVERSEKELRESRKKYKKIFSETPVGIFHYDEEGIITECNDQFVKIIGSSKEALIGLDMLKDLENDKLIEEIKSSLEEGEGYYEGEYTSVTGGKTTVLRVLLQGIRDEDNEIESGVGLVEDITERRGYEQELRRKERYLDHIPAYINVIDEDGEIKYHSYPSNEITGLDPSEFIGSEAVEFAHPDDREDALEMFSKVLENPGEEYSTKLRGEVEDGWVWFEVRAVNFLDDPEINGILVTAQDISEKKEAGERIEENKNKIESLHKISAELQTYDSEDDVYSLAVKAAEDILDFDICAINVPERDFMKAAAESSELPENASSVDRPLPIDDSLAGKTYLEKRSFLVKQKEENEYVNPTDAEFESGISVPIGEHAVFQVVSKEADHFDEEDLEMAELLMSHVSEALERIQAKEREEFLHSLLRHDVANKNQIFQGYLNLMKDHDLSDEVEDLLDKLERTTQESTEMIEKVRELRKVEEEEEIGELDLSSVMDSVITEHQDQLREEDIEIDRTDCDCKVKGGPLLEDLFSNLVGNSIKHSDCETIRISARTEGDGCVVRVEDDGVGISDELKDKIFEKGFKSGEHAGSGLGLYMVKEIAETYDGSVEVKDSEMGGVMFEIHLQRVQNE